MKIENWKTITIVRCISYVFIAYIVSIWFIPFNPSMPSGGLDPSWMFGMSYAVAEKINVGKEIIFTYGPYVSLYTHLYHPKTDSLIFLTSTYFYLLYICLLIINFKSIKWYYFAILILIISQLTSVPTSTSKDALFSFYPLLLFSYFYKKTNLTSDYKSYDNLLAILALTPIGLLPLIKGSILIICFVTVLLSIVLFTWYRNWLLVIATTFVPLLSMTIFWLLAGQEIKHLPSYFINIIPIISGYSEAMGAIGNFTEVCLFAFAAFILLLQLYLHICRDNTISAKAVLLVLAYTMFCFISFKAGFVRHDSYHVYTALTALLLSSALASTMFTIFRSVITLCITIAVILIVDLNHFNLIDISFKASIDRSFDAWRGIQTRVLQPDKIAQIYKSRVDSLHNQIRFPTLAGSTDIYSYDQSFLLASNNSWKPRPVFQSYSVYTPSLIQKNKKFLESNNRPNNLIFRIQPIDGRLPSIEDGASWEAILTHYDYSQSLEGYLLLKRRAKERKFIKTTLKKGAYRLGEKITIPESKGLIFAKINILNSSLGSLSKLVYQTNKLNITIIDSSEKQLKYKIISGMIKSGFLLSPHISNTNQFGKLFDTKSPQKNKVKEFYISTELSSILWNNQFELELYSLSLN